MSETEFALGTHCGVTFAGIKAASLFSIKKQCGKCLKKYEESFDARGFGFIKLRQDENRILMYVYNRRQLEYILSDPLNKKFLEEEGYIYGTAAQAIEILKQRMQKEEFPHEIGIFLNYPLEDVKGFIAHPNDGVKLVGYWKVYEGEEQKRRVFEVYEKCTRKIREKLMGGIPLEDIFSKTATGSTAT